MNPIRVLSKALILAAVLGPIWGAFYYVASRGSMSHALQAAWILAVLILILVPAVVVLLRRAGKQVPQPRLSRILILGGFLSIVQGFVVGVFTSPLRGVIVAIVMLAFFLVGAPLGWLLLRSELRG